MLLLLAWFILSFSFLAPPKEASMRKSKIEGLWKIVSYTDIYDIKREWMREKYKFVSEERFAWMDYDKETGQVFGSGGGTYTFDRNTYTETLEYYLADSTVIGTTITFTAEIKKGKWYHKGVFKTPNGNIKIDEVWERAE